MIDLKAYTRRIAYDGPLDVSLETLKALHRAHLTAVPYENLDVQLKRPTTVDPYAAFEKIVQRNRGGWCYEMNGVLGLVLEALGFDVMRLSGQGTEPHSHLVLTVDLGGETYVCDVGFADGPVEPYPLREGSFVQDGFEFRVENEPAGRWRLHNHRFGVTPGFLVQGPNEEGMTQCCHWLQTAPESPFVQHSTVFRRKGRSYISLIDLTLRTISSKGVTSRELAGADEYVATLKEEFDLALPEAATLWPQILNQHEAYLREKEARRRAKEAEADQPMDPNAVG